MLKQKGLNKDMLADGLMPDRIPGYCQKVRGVDVGLSVLIKSEN